MAHLSARAVALTALQRWRKGQEFADAVIAKLFGEAPLSAPDRALTLELFYGVLRNLRLLDFWLRSLRRSHLDVDLRDVLRIGLYQLLVLNTPEHAAVYETVELAPKRGRSLVNALLRAATRRRSELQSWAAKQPLPIRQSHPRFLVDRWARNFGADAAEALCRWNNRPPPLYARVNRLKITRHEFLKQNPGATPLAESEDFVELDSIPARALESGHCYIQDPSTGIACAMLDPQPGENILDACAAPGGKTAVIAQSMQNRGMLAACDRAAQRLSLLQENVGRLGATSVRTLQVDWTGSIPNEIRRLAPFDRALIDVPCTNTGVVRRRVDVRWRLRARDFERMRDRQVEIVRAVVALLKRGGVLVYSTCSLEPEENEQVVERLLEVMSILQLDEEKRSLPFRDRFDGAFVARLIRGG